MGWRVFILGVILLFRMFLGGMATKSCSTGQKIILTGNIDKIKHTISKDIGVGRGKTWQTVIVVGSFLAVTDSFADVSEGQRIRLSGTCRQSLLDFWLNRLWLTDAKILKTYHDVSAVKKPLWAFGSLQDRLVELLTQNLTGNEVGLIAGMVLGAKRQLGAELYQALVKTGTVHIVVASGYNVALIGAVVIEALILVFRRPVANWGATLIISLYALLTGFEPPVVRASLMFAWMLFSQTLGLAVPTWWLLLLPASLMLLWNPSLLVDVSFQLTFASTWGVMSLLPKLEDRVEPWIIRHKVAAFLGKLEILPTLSAQISTAPILLMNFGAISLYGLIVNVLVLPLVAPLTLAGMLLIVLLLFSRYLAVPLIMFCYSLSHLFLIIIKVFNV